MTRLSICVVLPFSLSESDTRSSFHSLDPDRSGKKERRGKLRHAQPLLDMLDSSESKLIAAVLLLYAALGVLALSLIRSSPRHGGNVFLGAAASAKRD